MNKAIKPLDKAFPNKAFPLAPGIYLFKDAADNVIYIGKAKSIKTRVASYFAKHNKDWKVAALISEYADVDYILTNSETEALLLEAQLISKHKPKFNVLLKSGQPFLYILFTDKLPTTIEIVRNKKEKGTYFGPFLQKTAARTAYHYLIRTFKLFWCNKSIENGCLDYHLGRCSGTCMSSFDTTEYNFRAQLAIDALKNNPTTFLKKIKEKIKEYNQNLEFEKSKHLNEYLVNMDIVFHTLKVKFSETKYENEIFAATTPVKPLEKNYDEISHEMQQLLKLDKPPMRIDCFDISHFQSSYIVGSCVRFALGKPDKNNFRHFNIKTLTEQNDYAALQEIVSRRYKSELELPDLIVIDGGKGQLSAAQKVLPNVPMVGLAKREETIYSSKIPNGVVLDIKSGAGQLLIALRDYAHHFAISHHRSKRSKGFAPETLHKKKNNT
ncbi:MAG: GIY-YIG nuclease family protein [Candidatus Babeliales bacterium]|nr:GIY-YIG nuclease family protein [Candidatus Babeliales bacterium]